MSQQKLPRSEHHERAVIGCMLEGYDDSALKVELFMHPGRQVLFMAVRAMRSARFMAVARSAARLRRCSEINADLAQRVVEKTDLWDVSTPLAYELEQCRQDCTQGVMIDWHTRIIGELRVRRLAIMAGERLVAMAANPAADMESVAEELAGAGLEATRLAGLEEAMLRMQQKRERLRRETGRTNQAAGRQVAVANGGDGAAA